MSDQIKPIGIALDTSGIDAGTAALDKLAATGPKVDSALKTVETAAAKTGKTLASLGAGAGDGFAETTKKVEPFVAKMGDADKAIKATGVSAGQTAQALRQLPAQLQDFFIQIQGGQSVLTAFAQQGSQVATSFGGVGNAVRAITGLISPAVVGAGLLAAGFGAVGIAAYQGSQELKGYEKALILTGNASGLTADKVAASAKSLEQLGITQGKAGEALIAVATQGKVGADSLERYTKAALSLERAGGPAVSEFAKNMAALGKDPLQAAVRLDEATNFLTVDLQKQIKALQDQGRNADAARVAQDAYAASASEATARLEANLGTLERLWRGVKEQADKAWDSMAGIGRPNALADQAKALEEQISQLRAAQRFSDGNGSAADQNAFVGFGSRWKAAINGVSFNEQAQAVQKELDALNKRINLQQQAAAGQAKENDLKKAFNDYTAITNSLRSQEEQRQQRVSSITVAGQKLVNEGKLTQVELDQRIAAINQQYDAGSALAAVSRAEQQRAEEIKRSLSSVNTLRATGYIREQQAIEDTTRLDLQAISNRRAALQAEISIVSKRQNSEKELVSLRTQLAAVGQEYLTRESLGRDQLTIALDKEKKARFALIDAEREQNAKDDAAAIYARSEAITKGQLAVYDYAKAIDEQNKFTELELSLIGETTQARELALAKLRIELDLKKQIDAIDENTGFDEAGRIEQRAKAREAAARAAAGAETRVYLDEWKRTADQINQSLTDALLRGFESGKGFAKNFRDTLVNAFKTMVLKPIISAVLQPISAAASGVINGVVGSVAGSVAGSVGAGVLGGLGIGALSASSIGSAIGAGFMNTIAGGTIAGGQAAGLLAGGGATGTGVAGMIGGALPWVGGAVLIANALGLFRSTKQVGAGITGTLGGTIEDFVVNRKSGTLFSGPKYSTPTVGVSSFNTDLQNTFNALRDQAGKFAEALGLSGEAARNFTTQIGSDQLSADTGGRGIRLEGLTPEQSSAKIKAALEAANDELARSVLGSFADSLKQQGETASQTLERLAGGLLSVNEVLKQLGQTAYQSSIEGAGLAASLLKQFDGIQQLQQLAGAYFENFYTEAERNALSTKQLSDSIKALGFQVPTTRDAFRALVEAQDLSTESGQKAYAELLKLAPSFAALVPAAQEAGVAVDDLAQQMAEAGRRALASLAEQTGSLQVDLLNAQGSTAEAAALARQQALAKITEGLSAQDAAAATAAYDLNAALKQQIDSTNAATQAAQDAASRQAAIASQRESIQARIDGLLGDTAAVRARELAALDDSNKALQEHYYQLEDQAAAAKTAADALQSVQNALSSLGDTRFDLENQLLTLQGDMASVLARTRDRDLAKLTAGMSEEDAKKIAAAYDYNTALQDQIDATKAAQKQAEESAAAQQRAADDAARAAQQVADAWKSAGNDLLKEAERIRATISGDSSSSFAQAQAKFAITLAQAGSGNLDAVKALPGLSQALLSLGEQQAVSFSDLQSLRNRTAASLERLAASLGIGSISATSSGSSGSPAIAATAYTASNFMAVTQSTQDELLGEIRALNEAVTVLRGQLDVSNANTGRAAKALEGDQSSPILVELAT